MTKICLIQAINEERTIQKRYPPLGLAYLASYLDEHGHKNIAINKKIEDVLSSKPDIVGISSVTQNYDIAIEIAQKIKEELEVPVFLGGNHISALPSSLPECVDIGVLGEGEQTVLEIMELFDDGKFKTDEFYDVPGIVFWDDKKLHITAKRPLIDNLDSIPPPKRELFLDEWGYEFKENMYMMTSRGCPYKCVFCSSSTMWEKTRFFSAEYVVNEIKDIIEKFNVSTINIYDDLFISNRTRLHKIVELVREEGLHEKTRFTCNIRAEIFNEDVARLLKSMNMWVVSFGAESGSDRVLSWLGKGTVQGNQNVIDICNRVGMGVACSFIFGSIIETKIDALKTYDFIKNNKNKLLFADVYPLVPFPGTKLWELLIKNNIISDKKIKLSNLDLDYDSFDIDKYLILTENLNKQEFYELFIDFQELHDDVIMFNQFKDIQARLSKTEEQIFNQNAHIYNLENNMNTAENWMKSIQDNLIYNFFVKLNRLYHFNRKYL